MPTEKFILNTWVQIGPGWSTLHHLAFLSSFGEHARTGSGEPQNQLLLVYLTIDKFRGKTGFTQVVDTGYPDQRTQVADCSAFP